MIIKFDFSPIEAEKIELEKISDLFSEAARASLLGHHRIVISRTLARWAVEKLDLSKKHREHINGIGQDFSQLGGLVDIAKYKILIRPQMDIIEYDNKGTWIIGIENALPEGFLSQTSLVLENAKNDGDFYKLLFDLNTKRLGFGEISYVPVHGGGNGAASEIRRISEQKKPVSCICDTDIKARGGAASETYNGVMLAKDKYKPVGFIVGTPAREMENFLPPQIIRKLTSNAIALDYIEGLMSSQGEIAAGDCLWLFLDIKDGFPKGVLHSYGRSERTRKWICKKYKISDEEIEKIEVDALGKNVVSSFMSSSELKGDLHRFIRSDYWDMHFLDWISDILWALAGRKRERVS